MNNSNEVGWEQSIWDEINEAVVKEVAKVRTAQKVFPTMSFDTPQSTIPNDVINFSDLSIQEGQTKAFVEIYHEFPLTATQVAKEAEYKTCKTLARMAAKAIALAEDTVIFRGQKGTLPGNVIADLIKEAENGLLGEAEKNFDDNDPNKISEPIVVKLQGGTNPGVLYGENTFSKVAEGIAKLTAKAQAPMFALFLPIKAYADTFVPPSNASLVTTAERIKPLVEGGFMETVTLPPNKGLLVALAGDPTSLYLGREATTEFVRKEGSKYIFRVVERIQFVARDPRAFVLLKFVVEIPKGLFFPSPKGKYITWNNVRNRHWIPIINKLMEEGKLDRYIKPYSLRHSSITRWLMEGKLDIASVARLSGNSTKVIMDNYWKAKTGFDIPEL